MNKIREFLERYGEELRKKAVGRDVANMPPSELHLELTYRCNTACVMCNLRYLNNDVELSVREISRFVEGSKLLGFLDFIVLSGGEPWLRDDFAGIVGFFRKRYPETNILMLSNLSDTGLALGTLAKLERETGLERLSIGSSIDGIGEAHDRVRGKPGCFESLRRTLSALREKYPGVYCSLNFTLTPENSEQMLPVFNWCGDNGYHVSFQVMVQKKETEQFSWSGEQYAAVDRQVDGIIERTCTENGITENYDEKLRANPGLLSLLLSYHYIPRYLKTRERLFPACPCGEKFAMISPSGDLYFCPVHKDLIAGNVAREGFDALWLSRKAETMREFFNRRKCHCWLTCTNGHMLGSAMADAKKKAGDPR